MISFNLNIFLDLASGVKFDHSGRILSEDSTALFTQSKVPDTTLEISSPEAGLKIGVEDKLGNSAFLPFIKWSTSFIFFTPKKDIKYKCNKL